MRDDIGVSFSVYPDDDCAYDIGAIRTLLVSGFTAPELRRFCQDRPIFHPILDRFGPNDGLSDMADRVIDYCRTRFLFRELLAEVRACNPRAYARFGPYHIPSGPDDTDSRLVETETLIERGLFDAAIGPLRKMRQVYSESDRIEQLFLEALYRKGVRTAQRDYFIAEWAPLDLVGFRCVVPGDE